MISFFNRVLHIRTLIFVIVAAITLGNATIEDVFQDELRLILEKYDPLYFPEIPVISINPRDEIDVSISFTNVTFSGLSSNLYVLNVDMPGVRPNQREFAIDIDITLLQLYAAEYAAGGHLLNLPFSGESYMKITLEDLRIKLGMDFMFPELTCAEEGTTWYQLDVRKPMVNFDSLNPGTDQGELVNTVLGGFAPDIVDYLVFLLNGDWHDRVDGMVVNVTDSILCNKDTTTPAATTTVA